MFCSRLKEKGQIGFIIGVVLAILHLCLVVFAYLAYINSRSSTAGLAFIWFFTLDAPILLLPSSLFKVFGNVAPLIQFGVLGSALWFSIPWLIDMGFSHIFPNGKRLMRVIVIVIAIPIVLAGFSKLSMLSIKFKIQSERPAELEKVLNRASSDFLTERIVFEDNEWASVNSLSRMDIRSSGGMEVIVAMTGEIVFLDDSYQEKNRLNFNDRGFNTIEPLFLDENESFGFLAYRYGKGAYLLDSEGKEIWVFTQSSSTGVHIDGADFGDVDGDGKTEFAFYYRYRDGIHLLDGDGNTKWKHPVYALGHLEITDLNGDGKAEIMYSNSNNANGSTQFRILNATGAIVDQMEISTMSYEFEVINWPNRESEPRLLLTEEAKIRIIDLKGDTVVELDAPGCRPFGKVKALTVKFKKDEPKYLVVKKNLHPDLSVLYVYSNDGKLMYQKTEVVEGGRTLALAVVPMRETESEGLLVGSTQGHKPLVLEYSLTR